MQSINNKILTVSDTQPTSEEVGYVVNTEYITYHAPKLYQKSIGCGSTYMTENDWSTPYTIECITVLSDAVSKSIELIKDIDMTIDTTVDTRPVHLYFNRDMETLQLTPELVSTFDRLPYKVISCAGWAELTEKIKLNPVGICFSYTELVHSSAIEIVNMVKTLGKLVGVPHDIVITVDVSKKTDIAVIKVLQKSDIFGIVPRACDFGWSECERGGAAANAKIPYWPKHIISQLAGVKKKTQVSPDSIRLTTRQDQILTLIRERGASNKTIAKTLNIAESTVKLHVGVVLKKFNVKNRTQLALFGKK